MRFKVTRYSIQIIPEDERDEAYLEEVLGLKENGDTVPLRRVPAIGLSYTWAYAEARKDT